MRLKPDDLVKKINEEE